MCFMKRPYKSLIAIAVLLLMSACQGSVAGLEPVEEEDNAGTAEEQQAIDRLPPNLLQDGENYVLFGYENAGHYENEVDPDAPIDTVGNIRRPSWINLEDIYEAPEYSKVLRIDDAETMHQHYRGEYDIDWSQKTLLLAYGRRNYQNRPWIVHFDNVGENSYLMTVDILPFLLAAHNWWRVAILVDKLDSEATIEIETPDILP